MPNLMKPPIEELNKLPTPGSSSPPLANPQPQQPYHQTQMVVVVLIAVGILGLALLTLAAGFSVTIFGAPTIASDQYYTAIRDQDYARAYSFLGSHLRTVYSQQEFTLLAQQEDALAGKVSHYWFISTPTGDPATTILTVTRANGPTYTVHLQVQQEAGTWKVTAFDRI